MVIKRIEIKDFLVFKGEFTVDFCPGINVIIGGNATGKTTLLRALYRKRDFYHLKQVADQGRGGKISIENFGFEDDLPYDHLIQEKHGSMSYTPNYVYIPEKDILEHSRGLLHFMESKQTGFDRIYKDMLLKAQDVPTINHTDLQTTLCKRIENTIGGQVQYDMGDGNFYTVKHDGTRIPFSLEASGHKKFGFLGLLITCGQLEPGSILFWDEPENSLNPEHVSVLVDILLELSRNGVQMFIATHSEFFASCFNVYKKKEDKVMFASLFKEGDKINVDFNERFDLLIPNNLIAEPVKLYEKEVEKGLGGIG